MTFSFEFSRPVWLDGRRRCGQTLVAQDAGPLVYHFTLPSPSLRKDMLHTPFSWDSPKALSTWLPRKVLGNSQEWLPESPAVTTHTLGVSKCPFSSSVFLVCVPQGHFLSAQDSEGQGTLGSAKAAEGSLTRLISEAD